MIEAKTCHADKCGNPVTGFCAGFDEPCGKPCCTEHSVKALCPVCHEKYIKAVAADAIEGAIAAMYDEFSDKWCEMAFQYIPATYSEAIR